MYNSFLPKTPDAGSDPLAGRSADPAITTLLAAHAHGESGAFDRLVERVYDYLGRLARQQLAKGPRGTLDTSGVVHDAYLRLVGRTADLRCRGHFFAAASQAMRHVIVDYARQRGRLKRGGDLDRVDLDSDQIAIAVRAEEMLDLDLALQRLEKKHPRLGRVVECRYFGGLSEKETAETLEVSLTTVQRDWRAAKVWLSHELTV